MTEKTTWLTPDAFRKLQEEFENLTTDGRKYIEERIAEARSHGDLRENADYDAAKNEQGMMEARIRQLRHLIDNAEVRESSDSDTVEIGSVVTAVDDDGDEMKFFVAPQENKAPGYIMASPESPLGGALIGAREGDEVTYEAPGGSFTLKVISIGAFEG